MTVKSNQVWTGNFVTLDATGLPAAATVGPVGALYVAGVVTGDAVTITGTNPYKFAVTLPALTAGQSVGLYVTATVGGIATAGVVAEESADTKLTSDLQDPTVAAIQSGLATSTALATVDDFVDDLEGRLTATRAGYLDNLSAGVVPTAAAIATAVWAATTRTLSSFGTLVADIVAAITASAAYLAAIAAAVWAYATRTLTQSAASVTSTVQGTTLTATRGDTFTAAITSLGSIASRSKLWFTVKDDNEDLDTGAMIQIEETGGLLYINGAAAATAANGSITVTNETTGALTIVLKAAETDDLRQCTARYDIQCLYATGVVTTLTSGVFDVVLDQTRAVA